jgi:hypothetical protein
MFDDQNDARRPTLVAGLILLIVLATIAAMSAESGGEYHAFAVPENTAFIIEMSDLARHFGAVENSDGIRGTALARQASSARTRTAATRRLVPTMHDQAIVQMMNSLDPIDETMAACFGDEALVAYDLGIAPSAAFDILELLLEATAPEPHAWLRGVLDEFRTASGLDPEIDLLPHLGHGVAVGLLSPEADADGWPFPRKVVLMRVLDEVAVARYLEAWISWVAGAVAPMTHGLLGASIESEVVGGFDLVGLRLDGLLPARLPLPSPSYMVADDFLIVSPVRSAVVETLNRLEVGCSTPAGHIDKTVVEEVWLNFPEWPRAWHRAEPVVAEAMTLLGVESPATVQTCRSLVALLGGFQPAHGTTTLTPEGGFVFHIEVEPGPKRGGQ